MVCGRVKPPESPTLAKKCPRCGHAALEHQLGDPNDNTVRAGYQRAGETDRYCRHPVAVEGENDRFKFCMCYINNGDYFRAGNYAMIDVNLPATRKEERSKLTGEEQILRLVNRQRKESGTKQSEPSDEKK